MGGLGVVLFLLLLDAVQADYYSHFVPSLRLPAGLLLSYILKRSVYHIKDVSYTHLVLFVLLHEVADLLLELQVAVMLRHTPPLQLLLDFAEALLDLLVALCLLALALLLLVLVDADEDADSLSC